MHEQLERLRYYLKGHEDAVEFCALIGTITQIWDDLHDQDGPVRPDTVDRAFEAALVHLPVNPFYIEHFGVLQPVVMLMVNAWMDANALIDGKHRDRLVLAYVLRDCVNELVIASARIIGGWAWMRQVSVEIRLDLKAEESLEEFSREVAS